LAGPLALTPVGFEQKMDGTYENWTFTSKNRDLNDLKLSKNMDFINKNVIQPFGVITHGKQNVHGKFGDVPMAEIVESSLIYSSQRWDSTVNYPDIQYIYGTW
jgi:hypothetical protein